MGLNKELRRLGGGQVRYAPWIDDVTPPVYPDDFEDPGDMKKFDFTVESEIEKDETWYHGKKMLFCQDLLSVGYTFTAEFGQIDGPLLAIAYSGEMVGTDKIKPFTKSLGTYAVRFIPKYVRGEQWTHIFFKASLVLSGSVNLIAPNYSSLTLTGTGLVDTTQPDDENLFIAIKST